MARTAYRKDIDGLRAVAVSTIVLFHFGVSALSGGYVGVDVFFVISGYLITGIIERERANGTFSFRGFFGRRVRRLAPALLVVLLGTLAAGYFVVPPSHYHELAESIGAVLLSISNIYFWAQTGYFDEVAALKPMLHTWSLGVEEQFYLVWPLLMVLVLPASGGTARKLWFLALLGVVSLVAAELCLGTYPDAVFYMMPFRVCEFAIGAALAVSRTTASGTRAAHALSVAGLALILLTVLVYTEATRFPGLTAMVPAVGAGFLIAAGPAGLANRALAWPPVVFIGRISYSLYLVHWPVLSFYAFRYEVVSGWQVTAALTAISVGLATLLYYGVETPFRKNRDGRPLVSSRQLTGATVSLALAVFAFGLHIALNKGYVSRVPAELRTQLDYIKTEKSRQAKAVRRGTCHFTTSQTLEDYIAGFDACNPAKGDGLVVVLGDSHAADIWGALAARYPEKGIVQITGAGCGITLEGGKCGAFQDFTRNWLTDNAARIATVIVSQRAATMMERDEASGTASGRSEALEDNFMTSLAELTAAGLNVVIWGPRPEMPQKITTYIELSTAWAALQDRLSGIDYGLFADLDRAVAARADDAGLVYLSSYAVLCPNGDCEVFDAERNSILVDYGHWGPTGGVFVAGQMIAAYPELAQALE